MTEPPTREGFTTEGEGGLVKPFDDSGLGSGPSLLWLAPGSRRSSAFLSSSVPMAVVGHRPGNNSGGTRMEKWEVKVRGEGKYSIVP